MMPDNPRVLMLIDTYPGSAVLSDYSGEANQLRALSPRLQAAGVEVRVLTSNVARRDAEDEVDGVRVIRLAAPEHGRATRFAQRVPMWLLRHRREWDIVHIHSTARSALAALAATRVLGKKSLLKFTLMGSDDAITVRESRLSGIKMRLLRLADAYAAPSTALAESVSAAGLPADRVARIPNGADLNKFAPPTEDERARLRNDLLEQFQWLHDALIALFVGAIEPRKGIDTLARAWPDVARRVPRARLLLVGPRDGARAETAAQFENDLRDAGVAETAALAGFSDRPEDFYRAADLFVFPSRGEGLPSALIEAHAAGLPSVAAQINGIIEDIIDEGKTGLIVPQDDPAQLSRALVALLEDDARRLRMGLAARARAEQCFSIDHVARRYVDLYAKLLSRG
ncbi:MAG TPA: glycosyltransferase family 4 protein [Candidatus Bathyarchaeia archaeon]|nr:glycosyltransferase family 4 protein [Candidatus Bathyarchaeia archaeon]